MYDIFIDTDLPAMMMLAKKIVRKSDNSAYFWHCLCENFAQADALKQSCDPTTSAYIIMDQASFDALPATLRNGTLPIHVYGGGLNWHV
jgi:hypothetical protein